MWWKKDKGTGCTCGSLSSTAPGGVLAMGVGLSDTLCEGTGTRATSNKAVNVNLTCCCVPWRQVNRTTAFVKMLTACLIMSASECQDEHLRAKRYPPRGALQYRKNAHENTEPDEQVWTDRRAIFSDRLSNLSPQVHLCSQPLHCFLTG